MIDSSLDSSRCARSIARSLDRSRLSLARCLAALSSVPPSPVPFCAPLVLPSFFFFLLLFFLPSLLLFPPSPPACCCFSPSTLRSLLCPSSPSAFPPPAPPLFPPYSSPPCSPLGIFLNKCHMFILHS